MLGCSIKRLNQMALLALGVTLWGVAPSARADIFVSQVGSKESAATLNEVGFTPAGRLIGKTAAPLVSKVDADQLAALATILFFPGNTGPITPGGSGGDGPPIGGVSGGGSGSPPPPGSEAPEPATLISGLIGSSLAGLWAAMKRRRN